MNEYDKKIEYCQVKVNELLPNYSLEITPQRKFFGQCNYRTKRIRINGEYIRQCSLDDVKETVLHEIAHGLCFEGGNGRGHRNPHFRRICRELGTNPAGKSMKSDYKHQYKYTITCQCGFSFGRDHLKRNLLRRYSCGKCGTSLSEAKVSQFLSI